MTRSTATIVLLSYPLQIMVAWVMLDSLHFGLSLLTPMLRMDWAKESLPVIGVIVTGFTVLCYLVTLLVKCVSVFEKNP